MQFDVKVPADYTEAQVERFRQGFEQGVMYARSWVICTLSGRDTSEIHTSPDSDDPIYLKGYRQGSDAGKSRALGHIADELLSNDFTIRVGEPV